MSPLFLFVISGGTASYVATEKQALMAQHKEDDRRGVLLQLKQLQVSCPLECVIDNIG